MAKQTATRTPVEEVFNMYRVTGGGVRKQFMSSEEAQKEFEKLERKLKKAEEGFTLKMYAARKVIGEKTEWLLLQETSYSDDSFED